MNIVLNEVMLTRKEISLLQGNFTRQKCKKKSWISFFDFQVRRRRKRCDVMSFELNDTLTARHSPKMNTQRKEEKMKRKDCACNTKEAQRKFSILSVGSKSFDSKKKFLPQKTKFLVWHVSQNPQGNRSSFLKLNPSRIP